LAAVWLPFLGKSGHKNLCVKSWFMMGVFVSKCEFITENCFANVSDSFETEVPLQKYTGLRPNATRIKDPRLGTGASTSASSDRLPRHLKTVMSEIVTMLKKGQRGMGPGQEQNI
jgi:hypothetical protein